jgi:hypothetical protein
MGCLCSKKKDVDLNDLTQLNNSGYTNRIFVGTTNIPNNYSNNYYVNNHCKIIENSEPLPIIEPIKTQRIIYEEKIKKIYYIEYNKQNDRRYKG